MRGWKGVLVNEERVRVMARGETPDMIVVVVDNEIAVSP